MEYLRGLTVLMRKGIGTQGGKACEDTAKRPQSRGLKETKPSKTLLDRRTGGTSGLQNLKNESVLFQHPICAILFWQL
jgi:hypothetical protein